MGLSVERTTQWLVYVRGHPRWDAKIKKKSSLIILRHAHLLAVLISLQLLSLEFHNLAVYFCLTNSAFISPRVFKKSNFFLFVFNSSAQFPAEGPGSSPGEAPAENMRSICVSTQLKTGWHLSCCSYPFVSFKPGVKNSPFCGMIYHLLGF